MISDDRRLGATSLENDSLLRILYDLPTSWLSPAFADKKPNKKGRCRLEGMNISSQPLLIDQLDTCLKRLLPETIGLQLQQVEITEEELLLVVKATERESKCPVCGVASTRVQSHYQRTLQDLPWGGLRVRLRLHVRRFFCPKADCPRQMFTERLPNLAQAYARRTNRLHDALLEVGWALGGEAGSCLCHKQAMPIAASTLLGLLRRSGVKELPTPRVLGVDDWGFQRKHPTGTMLVDLEEHRVVDLLMGSDEQVFKEWLRAHPGVDVISRDRGASYRIGATKGAPKAQQVLDRWHLLKNLGEVIQKTLAQQIEVFRQAGQQVKKTTQQTSFIPTESTQPDGRLRKPPRRRPPPPSPRRAWQTTMHQHVHELAAEGNTQADIVRSLHLHPHTVGKYLRMPTFVAYYCHPHPSPVEPYRAYLEERWQQGEVMITTLWQELQRQGFTGSYKSVWTFVHNWPLPAGMTPTSSSSTAAVSTRRGAPATRTPGSSRPHRTLEYRAGRRTDHQTQAAQTPDVWTCQPRSAASARAACGLIFSNSIWQHILPWLRRASVFTCSLLSYWERTRTATTFLLLCFLIFFLFCKLYTIPISKSWGEPRGW